MLCQRCSHPLPPLEGRCLRCFALNPAEKPLAPPMSFASDPPPPVMLELGEEAHGQIDWHRLPADPPHAHLRCTTSERAVSSSIQGSAKSAKADCNEARMPGAESLRVPSRSNRTVLIKVSPANELA